MDKKKGFIFLFKKEYRRNMMNTVYFVRHSKPDFSIKDDATRPLSAEGIRLCKEVDKFLMDKDITKCYSSPYKRCVETVRGFANKKNLVIETVFDLRERKVSSGWIDDFLDFARRQWEDFEYRLSEGECLGEVQERNIRALHNILNENDNKKIVIGTHGTALSTIINYYDKEWNFERFMSIASKMPLIIKMDFDGVEFKGMEIIDLFEYV